MGEEVFFNSHAVQQLQIRLERWSDWKKQCGNEWNEKIVREFEEMSTTKLDDYYYVLTRLGFSIDSSLLTFRNAPLSVNDVEYVAIRVLEPSDFHVASDVNIVLSGHVRHIVVFESDALGLEFLHDTLYILANHPC